MDDNQRMNMDGIYRPMRAHRRTASHLKIT